MIPLALSIVSSSVLLVIFKFFHRFEVKTFQAITVNYVVAASLGFLLSPISLNPLELASQSWLPSATLIGCIFITMFYVMAISSQKVGVAVSSVANKMSLVIPVVAGVILYSESLAGIKLIGVVTSLIGVGLVSFPGKGVEIEKKYLFLPLIIFLGSGFLDTFFKYVETYMIRSHEIELFSASLFMIAGLVGITVSLFQTIFRNDRPELKSVVGGIVLGIPNYFSIHFLLLALNLPNLESTIVFPLNNTGIVLLSTLLAIVIFGETFTKIKWLGIGLAVISILLIAFA